MILKKRKALKGLVKGTMPVMMALAISISQIPGTDFVLTAHAESDKTITGLCTGAITNPTAPGSETTNIHWMGSRVWYGTYNGMAVPYRVYDKATTEFGGNTMLLDCDALLKLMSHDSEAPHVYGEEGWANSEINKWLNGDEFLGNETNPQGAFSFPERKAITKSTKLNESAEDGSGFLASNGKRFSVYQPLTGEYVFLLDAVELTRTSYGYTNSSYEDAVDFRKDKAWLGSPQSNPHWLLRSPVTDYSDTVCDCIRGQSIQFVRFEEGVCPAFNLDLSRIVFTSFVEDSNEYFEFDGAVGEPDADYKLTILDDNLTIAQTTGQDVTRSGNEVTVPYTITGTDAGNATQVSVLITDSPYAAGVSTTAGFTYLKLNVDTWGTSGTGTFTLPSEYADKTCGTDYYVTIFAEDVNAGVATDYASAPASITVPVAVYNVTCSNDGNGSANATPASATKGNSISITATPNSNYQFKNWEVISGDVTLANATSQTTTFTLGSSDVEVKAHFEEIPPTYYAVQVTTDGNGSATASPASATEGAAITISATPAKGYQFKEWKVTAGGVTLDDASSAATTFDLGSSDVSIEATFEEAPAVIMPVFIEDDYLDPLREMLKTAVALGGERTITWNKGTGLPYDVMKTLEDHPQITLIFSYVYENKNYEVKLSGNVKANASISWCGPMYLYGIYGGNGAAQNTAATDGIYTVVKGDTLSGIARRLHVTVRHLVTVNQIANPNYIRSGQVLKY